MVCVSRIVATGSYLPSQIVTNDDLAKRGLDTNDEWIVTRTGIKQRHILMDDESTASMGYQAAKKAIESAKLSVDDIDMVIVATTTPDRIFPSVATQIQAMLGMKQGAAFDLQAVCSGFVYALAVANNFIHMYQAKNIIVIGSESMSRILDWSDRSTCVLFGDGAGAILLQAQEVSEGDKQGILSTQLYSDGNLQEILYTEGGIAKGAMGTVKMSGKDVFKHAVEKMSASIEGELKKNGFELTDLTWLIPHQANVRIIDAIGKRLGVTSDQVVVTVDKHANTSAASIPLALDFAVKEGKLKEGDLIAFTALGGGLTWGAALLKW